MLTFNEPQLINIDLIDIKDQVRKKFNDSDLRELANSILKVGIINPIQITPVGDRFDIVAGERRFRAAKMANYTDIPCIIVEGDQNRLKEIQLIENCQRKEINPIEELEAFSSLLISGYTPDTIAEQIGKSASYVHSRLKLSILTDRARSLLFNDEINMAHCKYLCVMSHDLQESALDKLIYTDHNDQVKFLPSKSFADFFNKNQSILLSNAKFDTESELSKDLKPCTKCPHNSEVNKTLFDGISSKAICNNPECFNKKTQLYISGLIKKFEGKGLEVIEAAEYYSDVYKNVYEYTELKDDKVDTEAMLIIVEGSTKSLGNNYPVYSESQIKAIKKAESITVPDAGDDERIKHINIQNAIQRFSKLVISRISENHVKKNDSLTTGVFFLAIDKLFFSLDIESRRAFLRAMDIDADMENVVKLTKAFFANLKAIGEKKEKALSIIALLHLENTNVYKDEPEFEIISILAKESDVDIESCRDEISKESNIDLSEV